MTPKRLSLSDFLDSPALCAARIDIPLEEWPGNCHAIACAFVKHIVKKGSAVYGHWHGAVHHDSLFFPMYSSAGFCRHGWVVMPDTSIIDPTRYVFEARAPYIYVGRASKEYDEGGNALRQALTRPPPPYNPDERIVKLKVAPMVADFVQRISNGQVHARRMSLMQAAWLANLPYDALAPYAKEVYAALEQAGDGAFIPIDNRQRAKREP